MKFCCFQFDAGTHVDISRGLPQLAELGDRLGAKFTFFVNRGRVSHLRRAVARAMAKLLQEGHRSAADEPGWHAISTLETAPAVLRAAVRSGHEIGWHGGSLRGNWGTRPSPAQGVERLHRDIEAGLHWLEECGIPAPSTVSSPARNDPSVWRQVLTTHGFRFLADGCDPTKDGVEPKDGLVCMPTNISAEPASSGYLEIMRLRGWSHARIVEDFRAQLATKRRFAMVCEHAFFAGAHALELVEELVEVARDERFAVETVSAAARTLWEDRASVPA